VIRARGLFCNRQPFILTLLVGDTINTALAGNVNQFEWYQRIPVDGDQAFQFNATEDSEFA